MRDAFGRPSIRQYTSTVLALSQIHQLSGDSAASARYS